VTLKLISSKGIMHNTYTPLWSIESLSLYKYELNSLDFTGTWKLWTGVDR